MVKIVYLLCVKNFFLVKKKKWHIQFPPDYLKLKWTGKNLTNCENLDYEPDLAELNKPYCEGCKCSFQTTYDCENMNRFSSLFNDEDCKESMKIWWYPRCTECIAYAIGDYNVQWKELSGYFLNWNEKFQWDLLFDIITFKLKPTKHLVILKIFSFLATRGESFPAQIYLTCEVKKAQDEKRKKDLEQFQKNYLTTYNKNNGIQTTLKRYFQNPVNGEQNPQKNLKKSTMEKLNRDKMKSLLQISNQNISFVQDFLKDIKFKLDYVYKYIFVFDPIEKISIQGQEFHFEESNSIGFICHYLRRYDYQYIFNNNVDGWSCCIQHLRYRSNNYKPCLPIEPRNFILELLLSHLHFVKIHHIRGPENYHHSKYSN